jgi:ABC-type lipoprotein release transport system permease subunit
MFRLDNKYWTQRRIRNSPRLELILYWFLIGLFGVCILVIILFPVNNDTETNSTQKALSVSYSLDIKVNDDYKSPIKTNVKNYVNNMNTCWNYTKFNSNYIPYVKNNTCNFLEINDVSPKEYDNDENLENTNLTTETVDVAK